MLNSQWLRKMKGKGTVQLNGKLTGRATSRSYYSYGKHRKSWWWNFGKRLSFNNNDKVWVCIQNLRSSTTCESCSSLESHVLFMKYTPSKPSLRTCIGIHDHAFIVINLPSYSPIFMKRTESNSQRYWNWQSWNQYDGVLNS